MGTCLDAMCVTDYNAELLRAKVDVHALLREALGIDSQLHALGGLEPLMAVLEWLGSRGSRGESRLRSSCRRSWGGLGAWLSSWHRSWGCGSRRACVGGAVGCR